MKKLESNHTQNTPQSDGTENHAQKKENTPEPNSENTWDLIKKFMKRDDASEWTMVALTFAIVMLTLVTVYFNCAQINQSERFSVIESRAYIRYNGITDFSYWTVGENGNALSSILNVGKTPAYHVYSISKFKYGEVEEGDWDNVNALTKNGVTLGAGQDMKIQAITSFAITIDDTIKVYKSMTDKSLTLFIFGKVWYDDAFGNPHWIRYCQGYLHDRKEFFHSSNFNDCDNYEKN